MATTYIVETESATPVHIQDLQIFVSKTTPVYITEAQLRSSLILTRLKSIGKVQVSEKKEARTVKQVVQPRSFASKPAASQAPAPKGVRSPPPPPQRPGVRRPLRPVITGTLIPDVRDLAQPATRVGFQALAPNSFGCRQ